ncbi:putative plant UBX domain-containing protein 14 [Panicum miliaceum]|uniref:Plant UBX domain-containing protein 14 n=1 Tax=Panicum miliaceum TaxID=4540 RepID=A0A3L6QRP8_PANMI|nr:putative plant UBX domain-containing protein 14 [Panicum miliaceum]
MADEALAAFMDVTGCGYDDAFHRLASCGRHLGRAVSRFFNVDAGPSGTRRSPPPQEVSETEEDDDDAAPAPAPAARPERRARGRSPSGYSPLRGREREAAGGEHSRGEKKRRRVREDDGPSRGGREAGGSRRRRRSADSSDSEEKAEANNRSRRRRLDPKDPTSGSDKEEVTRRRRLLEYISSDGDKKVQANDSGRRLDCGTVVKSGGGGKKEDGSSSNPGPRFRENISSDDDDMMVYEAAPPPPPNSRTVEGLFKVPHELTYKGGFHDAKAHAARRARWLLVNVQQSLEFPSFVQNRDVWASDMVVRCVRVHFVLWQADADARGGGRKEAEKVLGYYKIPRDRLPVVDPVTGQAVDRLHGTDPNDFLVSMGPYTDKNPTMPVVRAKKPSASPGAQKKQTPATTTAPTSRQEQAPTVRKRAEPAVAVAPTGQNRQQQAAAVNKPAEPVAAAVAAAPTGQQPAASVAKVCKLRVRLPDGRVVAKEFGSQCAVAELFAYCRSELGEAVPAAALRRCREAGNR